VKAFHKRQKTHFNFHHLTNMTAHNDGGSSIGNKSMQSGGSDLFDLTLSEMSSSRTMRKASDLSQQLNTENSNTSTNGNIPTASSMPPTNNSNSKHQKQLYLFYRTPSNKDKQKIDFSTDNNIGSGN
jgi:hypothetical protein